MVIEVAVPETALAKDKGDLLEALAQDFLRAQSFEVEQNVRLTAAELDLLCQHKVNGRKVYVECKAYRETLGADVLKSLLGTITFKGYEEGWLISAGPLGKDAKGFKTEWESRPPAERQKLSIYSPDRVIESFVAAGILTRPPADPAAALGIADLRVGEWLLLLSPFGRFWLAPILESGVPTSVAVLDAHSAAPVRDIELLKRVASTDCSLRNLDFEKLSRQRVAPPAGASGGGAPDKIVEVAHGESWTDYRPARPKDFVGRSLQLGKIVRLLEEARTGTTATRVFAITGDSGMGKSSLVAKLREKSRNKRHRRRFFVYALDARAARSSTYILLALVGALRAAAEAGFGDQSSEHIVVSDYADPLASISMQGFLKSLEDRKEVICLIFDQFEELYSKPDLFEIFEEAQRLFLSAVSAGSSLVLGFAWRTDSTVPQDHPAYYMWHKLADHRLEVALGPFSDAEASHAVTLFEKELGQDLHPELRRQVIENSQGYPWLLKKLCIHIFEQVNSGARQGDLRETLDAATLFDRDLQQLSQPQQNCLKAIAANAPADWFEILEAYGAEVLRGLQDRRLVVRSGDRINVYWDIFREYLLTKKTPAIPFTYVPSSPSLDALLRVAAQLRHGKTRTLSDLAVTASLGEKTVGNVVRDLRMFGIAVGDHSSPRLDSSLPSAEPKEVLQRIREVLRRHALTLNLNRLEPGTIVTIAEMADELRRLNPSATHRPETRRFYAERLASWLAAAGYLAPSGGDGWRREDLGTVVAAPDLRRTRVRGVFTGESPPGSVVEALEWLSGHPAQTFTEISAAGHRNAANVLARYAVISRGKDGRFRVIQDTRGDDFAGVVWRAVQQDPCVAQVVEMLRNAPGISGKDIGDRIGRAYVQDWSPTSKLRIGNALRRWAEWVLAGDGTASVPPVPTSRARRISGTPQEPPRGV